ncbi:Vps51/Vps67-domain-containing protein [Fomitopsis serialis]|uniref:Vps51/Vps67-domain-containing protein n=1 Tax=Fomitopsis serialis TaxID=139415 RepID=UPI002007E33D|nr:Vps51/Vps67-domain-containing protein [Neoantrodia serialis]KAH9930031.1 Vps51/Vps67-domain-containing protein [Neoantrodia serialis]
MSHSTISLPSSNAPSRSRTPIPDLLPRPSAPPSPARPIHLPPPTCAASPAPARWVSPPAGGERQKTRARDLLRKHYGLGVGPPPPLGGPARVADPMDLDSSAFDAKAYYGQLITTSSLPSLLKRENELLSEMRELDSERQSLVYNHHHELIAASDTIAAMKSRADHLDADLDLLRAAFSEISRLSTEITGRDS